MISLKAETAPYEIELPYGLYVTVRPLTTAGMAAAQAAARRRVDALDAQVRDRREAGLALDGLPDLEDEAGRDGLFQDLLIKELGVRHITAWSGIEDDPPVNPDNVAAIMDLYPVGERFFQEFTLRQVLLNAAKNGSGLSAAGTSSQAEGRDTAEPAGNRVTTAPEAGTR